MSFIQTGILYLLKNIQMYMILIVGKQTELIDTAFKLLVLISENKQMRIIHELIVNKLT